MYMPINDQRDLSEQFKNKSNWKDSIFGKVKTLQPDNYFENPQTKLSNKFKNKKIVYYILKKLYKLYYQIKGPFNLLPDFLILGPGACGTTSLMELYLRSNHNIYPSKNNEIFYFDNNHYKSINWYKIFFPSKFLKFRRKIFGKKTLTCEATGNYIFHPLAPIRIKKILPNAKFIVMMRNPVERSFSQYRRQIKNGRQKLSFEDAIELEFKIFEKEFKKFQIDEHLSEPILPTCSYIARSRYVESIERWLDLFPIDRFLFINSNEYFKDPIKIYHEILEFLNLPKHTPVNIGKRGITPLELSKEFTISTKTENYLKNYFLPWNEKLFELIGKRFDW